MKKIVIIFLMMFFLTGCGSKEEISEAAVKFVDINDKLVYDSFTHVVYIENYTYYSNMVYTPYYNANGKIVIYDGEIINCEMERINDMYVYDIYTNIVYIDNYTYYGNMVYTTYYDKNGQICYYDVDSQTIKPVIENTEIPID